jgi:proteic killer suppression protein
LDIEFASKKLEKVLNSEAVIRKKYGDVNGRKIMRRMEVLNAAPSLFHVPRTPPERCHQLSGDRDEDFAVDIQHPYRLLLRIPEPIPRKLDGGIDLSAVKRIVILGIEDYH